MGVYVLFVKILIFVVGVYELFLSRSAREEGLGQGGKGVLCEDCIGKERKQKRNA